jgi:hypothetical protein
MDARPAAAGAALTLALSVFLSPAGTAAAGERGAPLPIGDGRRTMSALPANLLRGVVGVVSPDNLPALLAGGVAAAGASFFDGEAREAAVGHLEWSETFETAGGPAYSTVFVAGMFTAGRFTHGRFRALTYDMLDAATVNFAWIREDEHWLSDVVAGAGLGFVVGRTVARVNGRGAERVAHATWSVSPIVARHARGARVTVVFRRQPSAGGSRPFLRNSDRPPRPHRRRLGSSEDSFPPGGRGRAPWRGHNRSPIVPRGKLTMTRYGRMLLLMTTTLPGARTGT